MSFPDHKCAPAIQLHALQEVWNMCQDAFALEEGESSNQEVTDTANAQLFLLLSIAAQSSSPSNRTMQFKGLLQGHDILILTDSGSSHSFLSNTVASTVQGLH
jgi:hypothetical protein